MPVSASSLNAVIASVEHVELAFSQSYVDIAVFAEATFPDRLGVEVVTPADATAKSFGKSVSGDAIALADQSTRGVTKASADSVVMQDDADIDFVLGKILADVQSLSVAKVIALAKALIDIATASDAKALLLSKALQDSGITFTDLQNLSFVKTAADSISLTDNVEAVRLFIRTFAETLVSSDVYQATITKAPFSESVGPSDTDTLAFSKPASETVNMIDNMDGNIEYAFIKLIGELISTPTDQAVSSVALAKTEAVTAGSSGVAFMTDYADISYFAEDYVGVSSTFN